MAYEKRNPIPVRDPEVERRSAGSGPVITRPMTAEERERYGLTNQREEQEDMGRDDLYPHVNKEFLEAEFAAGKSVSAIEREQGMPAGTLSYRVRKFGLHSPFSFGGKKREDTQTAQTDDQVEIDRLREELAKALGERNALKDEIGRWKDDCRELSQEVIDKEKELAEIVNQRDELKVEVERWKAKATETIALAGKALDQQGMSLNHYQQQAKRTASADWDKVAVRVLRYPTCLPLLNFALGAAGEAGEIADYIKKVIFHGHDLDEDKLIKEIGDALWYLSQIAQVIGVPLEVIAEANIAKLQARYPEGFSETASQNREADAG